MHDDNTGEKAYNIGVSGIYRPPAHMHNVETYKTLDNMRGTPS
jgi:hypothetical protein